MYRIFTVIFRLVLALGVVGFSPAGGASANNFSNTRSISYIDKKQVDNQKWVSPFKVASQIGSGGGYNTETHATTDFFALDFFPSTQNVGTAVYSMADATIWYIGKCSVVTKVNNSNLYITYYHILPQQNLSNDMVVLPGQTQLGSLIDFNHPPNNFCGRGDNYHTHIFVTSWSVPGATIPRTFPDERRWKAEEFHDICGKSFPYTGKENQYASTDIPYCSPTPPCPEKADNKIIFYREKSHLCGGKGEGEGWIEENIYPVGSGGGREGVKMPLGSVYFPKACHDLILPFDPDKQYKIKSLISGLFLDVNQVSNENNASILQWYWNGDSNQRWKIEAIPEIADQYQIRALNSNKCLSV